MSFRTHRTHFNLTFHTDPNPFIVTKELRRKSGVRSEKKMDKIMVESAAVDWHILVSLLNLHYTFSQSSPPSQARRTNPALWLVQLFFFRFLAGYRLLGILLLPLVITAAQLFKFTRRDRLFAYFRVTISTRIFDVENAHLLSRMCTGWQV